MKRLLLFSILGMAVISLLLYGCASSASQTPAPTSAKPAATSSAPAISSPPAPSGSAVTTQAPAASGQPSAGKAIVLRAVSFLPTTTPTVKTNMPKLAQRIQQRTNGQVTIQFLGGPEVIPPASLADALQRNVVQLAFLAPESYEGKTGIGNMWALSELTPDEERASGAYDYINDLHTKIGLFYLERASYSNTSNQFNIISNKLIDNLQKLAGVKLGGTATLLTPFCQKVGASAPVIPQMDFYSAAERGVVDGIWYPLQNSMALQLYEVTKYILDPPFYRSTLNVILNLDSWNSIPKEMQTTMKSVARDVVYEWMDLLDKEVIPQAYKMGTDHGMKVIKFSDSDTETFLKLLYDTQWEDSTKRYPEVAAKLKPMIQKKK
jgi:TRAP-type transport system periplasmic protein